jgi:dipeptidase D
VVLTTVEEAGMDGAKDLDFSLLSAKRLINLDNGEEEYLLAGCAGGAKVTISLPIEHETKTEKDLICFEIFVGGLKGGHSGADINLGRGNSNKILARVLNGLKTPFSLKAIEGGSKDNAIPREAFAKICIKSSGKETLKQEIAAIEAALKKEFKTTDPEVFIRLTLIEDSSTHFVFNAVSKKAIVDLLLNLPFGVDSLSADFDGLVETSNNLGVVRVENNSLVISCSVRSMKASGKRDLCQKIVDTATALGAKCDISSGYPGWEYNPDSPLREAFKRVYSERYKKDPIITSIHAGLECGIFADKIPGVDMVSIGPDLYDLHTPDERASISSTKRVYEYLVEVLGKL